MLFRPLPDVSEVVYFLKSNPEGRHWLQIPSLGDYKYDVAFYFATRLVQTLNFGY